MLNDNKQANNRGGSRFKPGETGNKKGRPRRSPELKTAIQHIELGLHNTVSQLLNTPEEFEEKTYLDRILINLLNKGDYKNVFWMIERVIGKARRAVDIKIQKNESSTGLEGIPTEKLERIKTILQE